MVSVQGHCDLVNNYLVQTKQILWYNFTQMSDILF